MASVPEDRWYESMHFVRRDGTVRSAGDAVIEVLALSSRTRPLAAAARALPPVRALIRRQYERVAATRGERAGRSPEVEPIVDPPRVLEE